MVGKPVLVALSGGADSVALMALVALTGDALGFTAVGGHVHHHLRGDAADDDALFCVELGKGLGVAVDVAHLDPQPPRGISPEAHWRELRYDQLERLRQRHRCAAVATAHTLDDQAETVLFKVLRGAGPRGVAGIRRRRGTVIRPVLAFTRAALREWLVEHGMGWREDASNLNEDRPRTWLRHNLLPLIDERFPRAVEHLAAFAGDLAEDEAVLMGLLARSGSWPEVGRPVPLQTVASMPQPLQRRWVLELARRLPLAEPPSRVQLRQCESLFGGGRPAAVDLGRRWVLRRRSSTLHICPPPCEPFAAVPAPLPSELKLPGGFSARLDVEISRPGHHRVKLHPRTREASLMWRSPRPGERWRGAGRLSRALAAAGVVAEWRRAWPVLEANGTIVWVPAVGVVPEWAGDEGSCVVADLEVPWEHRESLSGRT